MKTYKCQFCKYRINIDKTKKGIHSPKYIMGKHYDEKHGSMLGPDMDGYRFFYYTLTGKDHGSCVICHNPTEFNRTTMKYSRFCNNPQCKQKYKEERDQRMINKYGKITLLNDPEQQKKMLANRKISGTYVWSDGKTKIQYVGSYEEDFFRYLDRTLHWPAGDIMAPSPHMYHYKYADKDHFYIPDAYIPSLNLEIEIKSSVRQEKQNPESRDKEIIKDKMMKSCSNICNYIKINDKDYTEFAKLIQKESDK